MHVGTYYSIIINGESVVCNCGHFTSHAITLTTKKEHTYFKFLGGTRCIKGFSMPENGETGWIV